VSAENTELVREMYAAWDRGDMQAVIDSCDPEVIIVQPPEIPDSKSYRGHPGVVEALEDWPSQWDRFEARLGEVIELDERHVISQNKQSVSARGMSMEQDVFFLHTVDNGLHVRVDMFLTREEAEAAAT
jgi:ketosteroid isomerase-like protein